MCISYMVISKVPAVTVQASSHALPVVLGLERYIVKLRVKVNTFFPTKSLVGQHFSSVQR